MILLELFVFSSALASLNYIDINGTGTFGACTYQPRSLSPYAAIRRSHPCEARKQAHGHPRTTPSTSLNELVPGPAYSRVGGLGEAEPDVVVAVIRRFVVPVSRTHVPRFVVPGAATQHATAAYFFLLKSYLFLP